MKYKKLKLLYNDIDIKDIIQIIDAIKIKKGWNKGNYIYFISDGAYCKIGKAKDLSRRFNALQTSNSRQLSLLGFTFVPDSFRYSVAMVEYLYHNLFQNNHIRGEWFNISDYDIRSYCHFTLEDYYAYRFIETKYHKYKTSEREYVNLKKAFSPIKCRERLFDTYKRNLYGADEIVGVDEKGKIYYFNDELARYNHVFAYPKLQNDIRISKLYAPNKKNRLCHICDYSHITNEQFEDEFITNILYSLGIECGSEQ